MLNRGYKSRVNGSFFLMRYFSMLALCAVGFIVTTTSAMGDPEVSGEVVDVQCVSDHPTIRSCPT